MTADVVSARCQNKSFLNPKRRAESAFEKRLYTTMRYPILMQCDTPTTVLHRSVSSNTGLGKHFCKE